jgi:hypothetical protein
MVKIERKKEEVTEKHGSGNRKQLLLKRKFVKNFLISERMIAKV